MSKHDYSTERARKALAYSIANRADVKAANASARAMRKADRRADYAKRAYLESLYLSDLEA